MSTTVTLQLNAIDHAGDWANRPATQAQTRTGELGAGHRHVNASADEQVLIRMSELRGAVEAIRSGAHSPTLADSRTEEAVVGFGTPALYCGMRFDLDAV